MSTEPVHRTILVVDIEGFSQRTNSVQAAMHEALKNILGSSFDSMGVRWEGLLKGERGDSWLIIIGPEISKRRLVDRLPGELVAALRAKNQEAQRAARIRLRMSLHAGEVIINAAGAVIGHAVNHTFRLNESNALKFVLKETAGDLAINVSEWFYDEVIRHEPEIATAYHKVRVVVKETEASSWLSLPASNSPDLTRELLDRWRAAHFRTTNPSTLKGHAGAVRALAYTVVEGRPVVVSGGDDHNLLVWDLATGNLRPPLSDHTKAVATIECARVGDKVLAVSGGGDGQLRIWDLAAELRPVATPRRFRTDRVFKYPIIGSAYTEINGNPVVVTAEGESRGVYDGADCRVRIWDLKSLAWRATLFNKPKGHLLTGITCTTLHGRPVAVLSRAFGALEVWRLDTRKRMKSIPRRAKILPILQGVSHVVSNWIDDDPVIIACGYSRASVWDLRSRRRLFRLEAGSAGICAAAGGRLRGKPIVVIGRTDGELHIWNLSTRQLLRRETGAKLTAITCGEENDRTVILAGTADGGIYIWDLDEEFERELNK